MLSWNNLEDVSQLEKIKEDSFAHPVLIFKHSTRCSISSMALARLERNWRQEDVGALAPYLLDLVAYRAISNQIAQVFSVEHQSPQLLLIKDGVCCYHSSHNSIRFKELLSHL